MSNIFNIVNELKNIYYALEMNEGELTEDLEARLSLANEDFDDKVDAYSLYLKMLKSEMQVLKDEAARFALKVKHLDNRTGDIKKMLLDAIVNAKGYTEDGKVKHKTTKTSVWSVDRESVYVDSDFDNSDFIDYAVTAEKLSSKEVVELNKTLVEYATKQTETVNKTKIKQYLKEYDEEGELNTLEDAAIVTKRSLTVR